MSVNLPGTRLRALAEHLFDRTTIERLIDPAIADLQCEHADAVRHGRLWRARRVRVAGVIAFCKVATWAAFTKESRGARAIGGLPRRRSGRSGVRAQRHGRRQRGGVSNDELLPQSELSPGLRSGVSWDGHICGAAAGILAAYSLVLGGRRGARGVEVAPPSFENPAL